MTQPDKRIVIGGADGFLGRHAAAHFASKGFNVFGTCFSAESRAEAALFFKKSANNPNIELHNVNLAKEGEVKAFAAWILKAGCINYLLNAAGAFVFVNPLEATEQQFDLLFNANIKSNWLLTKHFMPEMVRQKFGRIVLISAAATKTKPASGMELYVGSKTALNSLVDGMANGLEASGETCVRINLIAPTIIDTPRNRSDMPNADFQKWATVAGIMASVEALMDPQPKCPSGTFLTVGN